MIRPRWMHLFVAVVLVGAITASSSPASAHWGRGCGQSACWSCDSCCSPYLGCGYYPSYSCGWTGGCGNLGCRPYGCGYNGGYYGGWGYYGWGWNYYGCGCGSYGAGWLADCGCGGSVFGTPAVATPTPPAPGNSPTTPPPPAVPSKGDTAPALPPTSQPIPPIPGSHSASPQPYSGMLTLHVPSQAKVYVNGQETHSIGSQREYVSFGLETGKTYPYSIKVATPVSTKMVGYRAAGTMERPAGEDTTQWTWSTKTVYLKAGDRLDISFAKDLAAKLSDQGWTASMER